MSTATDTDVLVVGGGLVGLATAAFLAYQGTRTILVEQHPGTSQHPKARLVNVRSMELFRALGIESDILDAGEPNAGFALAETWPPTTRPGSHLRPTNPTAPRI